jgi:hypothetical protein
VVSGGGFVYSAFGFIEGAHVGWLCDLDVLGRGRHFWLKVVDLLDCNVPTPVLTVVGLRTRYVTQCVARKVRVS